jgi:hypothetical protein
MDNIYSRSHDAVIRLYDEGGESDRDTRAERRVQTAVNFPGFTLLLGDKFGNPKRSGGDLWQTA